MQGSWRAAWRLFRPYLRQQATHATRRYASLERGGDINTPMLMAIMGLIQGLQEVDTSYSYRMLSGVPDNVSELLDPVLVAGTGTPSAVESRKNGLRNAAAHAAASTSGNATTSGAQQQQQENKKQTSTLFLNFQVRRDQRTGHRSASWEPCPLLRMRGAALGKACLLGGRHSALPPQIQRQCGSADQLALISTRAQLLSSVFSWGLSCCHLALSVAPPWPPVAGPMTQGPAGASCWPWRPPPISWDAASGPWRPPCWPDGHAY